MTSACRNDRWRPRRCCSHGGPSDPLPVSEERSQDWLGCSRAPSWREERLQFCLLSCVERLPGLFSKSPRRSGQGGTDPRPNICRLWKTLPESWRHKTPNDRNIRGCNGEIMHAAAFYVSAQRQAKNDFKRLGRWQAGQRGPTHIQSLLGRHFFLILASKEFQVGAGRLR